MKVIFDIPPILSITQSGREDSNFRPLAPHASALANCATPRYYYYIKKNLYKLPALPTSCRDALTNLVTYNETTPRYYYYIKKNLYKLPALPTSCRDTLTNLVTYNETTPRYYYYIKKNLNELPTLPTSCRDALANLQNKIWLQIYMIFLQ